MLHTSTSTLISGSCHGLLASVAPEPDCGLRRRWNTDEGLTRNLVLKGLGL